MLQNGPFRHVSVSPNGNFVALFTGESKVWVVSSDFQNKFSEYDSGSKVPPNYVEWCGNDTVVLAWEDEVHVVGPNGAAARCVHAKSFFEDNPTNIMRKILL